MADVLILGNGISRLLHERFIRSWTGEFWACNYAFREWGEKITLLGGHSSVLIEAMEYREQHGLNYVIFGALFGRELSERPATCPGEYHKNTGTTLIAQAHEDGFDTIYLCGFDCGGPDLLSPGLEQQRKQSWVRRLRALIGHYGTERIRFVGFDHIPFLLGKGREDTYQKRYTRGVPHVPDPAYIALHNLIYGGPRSLQGEGLMKVRFLTGKNPGFVTEMSEDSAMIYAAKGKVEILGVVSSKPIDETGLGEITADTKITNRMTLDTLRKIAGLKGIDDTEGLTKAEIVELLEA